MGARSDDVCVLPVPVDGRHLITNVLPYCVCHIGKTDQRNG